MLAFTDRTSSRSAPGAVVLQRRVRGPRAALCRPGVLAALLCLFVSLPGGTAKGQQADCPEGKERNVDTAGRCCWPGQITLDDACVGTPSSCPRGFEPTADGCTAKAKKQTECSPGRTPARNNAEECCWPGQGWSSTQGRCLGKATCPEWSTQEREGCSPRLDDGMVYIPGGEFWMGEDSSLEDSKNSPRHAVRLSPYWLDRLEVTVSQYRKCVSAGGCPALRWSRDRVEEVSRNNDRWEFNYYLDERLDHPMNYVTWDMARSYCNWRGKRLPTEAEWEYAAVGTDGRQYPWGDSDLRSCELAASKASCWGCANPTNKELCEQRLTWPVGRLPAGASPFGVLDMAGGVAEWTSDWFSRDYYSESPRRDPKGPSSGEGFFVGDQARRVIRGTSYDSRYHDVLERFGLSPEVDEPTHVGVRCARSARH